MRTVRVIPCLDVTGGRVVKGVKFEGLRDVGDPVALAERYAAEGADEIVFLDVSAGMEGRRTALEVVERTARRVFVPLTAGGGVRRVEDARDLLRAGCDKVAVNSAAVRDPSLIDRLAAAFGSQCVVAAVDARRDGDGWTVAVDAGRTATDLPAVQWIAEAQARGAGEVLLTAVDRDGVNGGYDCDLIRAVSAVLRVPLVASGGFGRVEHAVEAVRAGADAVLAASVFHEGRMSVRQLKEFLRTRGVEVRPC
ncbi:MAG: imidazole glycerol phosphate synthase subunit HisF [Acidobacteria bacterium]|nr:imidazole glycerol phosphate synthase subunit HisF [Acidobacteriota bacterium]